MYFSIYWTNKQLYLCLYLPLGIFPEFGMHFPCDTHCVRTVYHGIPRGEANTVHTEGPLEVSGYINTAAWTAMQLAKTASCCNCWFWAKSPLPHIILMRARQLYRSVVSEEAQGQSAVADVFRLLELWTWGAKEAPLDVEPQVLERPMQS